MEQEPSNSFWSWKVYVGISVTIFILVAITLYWYTTIPGNRLVTIGDITSYVEAHIHNYPDDTNIQGTQLFLSYKSDKTHFYTKRLYKGTFVFISDRGFNREEGHVLQEPSQALFVDKYGWEAAVETANMWIIACQPKQLLDGERMAGFLVKPPLPADTKLVQVRITG